MKQWFGPKGAKMLFNEIDLRAGGGSRYGMEFAQQKMFGLWAYTEIKAPEKIVAIVSFLDEKGKKLKHPMSPGWPMDIHSVMKFIDQGEKTKITVEWTTHNATPAETKTFEEGAASMEQGWGGSFEQLAEYLAKR